MSIYDDFFNRASNYHKDRKIEYYEDTHDEFGNYNPDLRYIEKKPFTQVTKEPYERRREFFPKETIEPDVEEQISEERIYKKKKPIPLSNIGAQKSQHMYQNVVVYEPKEPEDVQALIDYLKRKEPAIVNLDKIDEIRSQRILDFISGAIYALNGSVHRISGNIFLLSPEGIEITVPYDPNRR